MVTDKKTRRRNRRDDSAAVDLPPELDGERALDATQTKAILNVADITLAQWRAAGKGPRFFRVGRSIRYRLADVLAFRDARMVGRP